MPNLNKQKFEELTIAGSHMSNWLFNMRQKADVPPAEAKTMQEMVAAWDAALSAARRKRGLMAKGGTR